MYCSTCGARVPEGASRCTNCGAAVSRPVGFGVPAVAQSQGVPLTVAACPRCGFQGPTVGYFTQGGHIAALLILTAVTVIPAAGFGGLLYYLLRRDHRSCARCGETLGKRGELALAAASHHGAALPASTAAEADLPEGGGMGWAVGSTLFFLFAAFMILVGFGEGEAGMVMTGLASAGVGGFLLHRARSAREDRRQALLLALQQPVLRLAGQREGRLTVTEVASTLGWPMRRAEKVLNSLDDGLRVVSDVTNEGVIVYDFRELRHAQQQRFSAEEMDALLISGNAPPPPMQLQQPGLEDAFPPVQRAAQPEPRQAAQPFPQDGTLRA